MKIALVYPGHESLGLEYLSAVLKQNGHQTRLFFDPVLFNDDMRRDPVLAGKFDYSDEIVERLGRYRPDVVGFSVLSTYYPWALNLAGKIKRAYALPVVFGGIHPTAVPEYVLRQPCIDFVVAGEGEGAFPDLLRALEDKKKNFSIDNVWYRNNGRIVSNPLRPLLHDLDELPFPDKDLFYDEVCRSDDYSIMTGRGCPNSCSFCNSSFIKDIYRGKGTVLRKRSVGNVIEELRLALDKYDPRMIVFDDELLTYDRKWLREFSREYEKKINRLSFCWVSPPSLDDETIGSLKRLNCYHVHMGIQTFNRRTREAVLNRYSTNEQTAKAISLLQKNKIRCTTEHILGLPQDTADDYLEMVRFYSRNRVQMINVYNLQYFPKTKIIEKMNLPAEKIEKINQALDFAPFEIFRPDNDFFIYKAAVSLLPVLPGSWVRFLLDKKMYRTVKFLAGLCSGFDYFSVFCNPAEGIRRFYLAGGFFIGRKVSSQRYHKYIPRILFSRLGEFFSPRKKRGDDR